MDINSTTSLRDRINALNMSKISQLSPQRQRNQPKEEAQQRNSIYNAPKLRKSIPESVSVKNEPSLPNDRSSRIGTMEPEVLDSSVEGFYDLAPSNIPVTNPTSKQNSTRPTQKQADYKTIEMIPQGDLETNSTIQLEDNNENSIYNVTPNNIPIHEISKTAKSTNHTGPVKSEAVADVSSDVCRLNLEKHLELNGSQEYDTEENPYAIPRSNELSTEYENNPIKQEGIYTTSKLAEDISSRWQTLRKTVKDPRLREMVDMSVLKSSAVSSPTFPLTTSHTTSEGFFNDVTKVKSRSKLLSDDEEDDVMMPPVSPDTFRRSQSLGDNLFTVDRKGSDKKRPSLPGIIEKNASAKSSIEMRLSPERFSPIGISRQSSATSNSSMEGGRPRNLSDVSNTSLEVAGRPRNVSNVSVTHEENNYIAFGSLGDGSNDNMSPNERTLVVVKGDTSYSSKVTLAAEPASTSPTSAMPEREISKSNEELSDAKKGKNKKFKVFGKLTKAVKHKMSSSAPSSPFSASKTTQSRQFPQSPKSMTSSPKHLMTQPRYNKSPLRTAKSPSDTPPSPLQRPLSHGGFEISSPSFLTPTLDEGVYYDPSAENGNEEEFEESCTNDDVIRIEYDEESDVPSPLTPTKRSQSMASLSQLSFSEFGNIRKLSEDLANLRQISINSGSDGMEPLYMVSSGPPIPPPKPKSNRRKEEKKKALSSVTSSNDIKVNGMTSPNFASNNGQTVRLRKSKFTFDKDRKDWPGGRPPSMPGQIPPSPPRPTSMPLDEPPQPETPINEENEYVAASVKEEEAKSATTSSNADHSNIASLREKPSMPPTKRPSMLPKPPLTEPSTVSKKTIPAPAEHPITDPNDLEEDSIYHDIPDPINKDSSDKPATARPIPPPKDKAVTSPGTARRGYAAGMQNIRTNTISASPNTKDKYIPARPNSTIARTSAIGEETIINDLPISLLQQPIPSPVRPTKPKPPGKPALQSRNSFNLGKQTVSIEKPIPPDLPTIKPPPRPSKMNKYAPKQDKSVSLDEIDSPAEFGVVKPRIQSNPAITELGKLLAARNQMSPKKFSKPSDKPQKIDEKSTETPKPAGIQNPVPTGPKRPPKPTSPTESKKPPIAPPPAHKQPTKRLSITTPSKSIVTSSPGVATPSTHPIAKLIQQRNEALSKTLSEPVTSPKMNNTQKRPAPRKPTGPPPPRPNTAPPPRPDDPEFLSKSKQTNKPALNQGGKAGPPRRPPPPSSDKIKEAEERKKNVNERDVVTNKEDDYNDFDFRHVEESNPYADIDDIPLSGVFDYSKQIKDIRPTPPTRAKQGKKVKSSRSFGMIANMKTKLVKQRHVTNAAPMISSPGIVTEQAVYNDGDEEGVYAGIDDFIPPNAYSDVTMPQNGKSSFLGPEYNQTSNGAYMTSYDDEFDD